MSDILYLKKPVKFPLRCNFVLYVGVVLVVLFVAFLLLQLIKFTNAKKKVLETILRASQKSRRKEKMKITRLALIVLFFTSNLNAGLFGEGVNPDQAMADFEWAAGKICSLSKGACKGVKKLSLRQCVVLGNVVVALAPTVQQSFFPDCCDSESFEFYSYAIANSLWSSVNVFDIFARHGNNPLSSRGEVSQTVSACSFAAAADFPSISTPGKALSILAFSHGMYCDSNENFERWRK
jgi:hypothetical protein